MKIMVLGGDGYRSRPTVPRLSDAGHDVVIVDNQGRRTWDEEDSATSRGPIALLEASVTGWAEVSGREIVAEVGCLLDWEFLSLSVERHRPDAIFHHVCPHHSPHHGGIADIGHKG